MIGDVLDVESIFWDNIVKYNRKYRCWKNCGGMVEDVLRDGPIENKYCISLDGLQQESVNDHLPWI